MNNYQLSGGMVAEQGPGQGSIQSPIQNAIATVGQNQTQNTGRQQSMWNPIDNMEWLKNLMDVQEQAMKPPQPPKPPGPPQMNMMAGGGGVGTSNQPTAPYGMLQGLLSSLTALIQGGKEKDKEESKTDKRDLAGMTYGGVVNDPSQTISEMLNWQLGGGWNAGALSGEKANALPGGWGRL